MGAVFGVVKEVLDVCVIPVDVDMSVVDVGVAVVLEVVGLLEVG